MSVFTVDDVAKYLGRTFTAKQEDAVATIVAGIQGELESWLGRRLEVETRTGETYTLDDRDFLRLKGFPVISVASLSIDGTSYTADDYLLRPWGIERLPLTYLVGALGSPPVLTVTYTAGTDLSKTDNAGVRMALLRGIGREVTKVVLDDAVGVAGVSVEGYSVDYESVFTDAELGRIKRLKRRTVG